MRTHEDSGEPLILVAAQADPTDDPREMTRRVSRACGPRGGPSLSSAEKGDAYDAAAELGARRDRQSELRAR